MEKYFALEAEILRRIFAQSLVESVENNGMKALKM